MEQQNLVVNISTIELTDLQQGIIIFPTDKIDWL